MSYRLSIIQEIPMRHSTALPIAWVGLRILILINWLSGLAIAALLTSTIVAEQWTFTALGITPESGIPQIMMGLRAVAVLGIVALVLNHFVLIRMLKMV